MKDPEIEERTVNRLRARNLDALIVASAATTSATFKHLQDQGCALILIDRRFPDLDTNYVGADDELIGTLATEHLIQMGCRRIAHLRGPNISAGKGRLNGYLRALSKHNIRSFPGYVSALSAVEFTAAREVRI